MDPITLTTVATQVVTILTAFFSKAGEAIAARFGEDAYEGSKHLYETIHDHFASEDDGGRANRALQNFTDDPQLYSAAFKEVLLSSLQTDTRFAQTLHQTLQTGPVQRITVGLDARVENVQMGNELGQGSQTIEGGDRSTFSGISMNIGPKGEQGS